MREEERASLGGLRCSEKVGGALGFELGPRGWIRLKGGQRWQKRHEKEDSYQAEGPGEGGEANCEDGSLAG